MHPHSVGSPPNCLDKGLLVHGRGACADFTLKSVHGFTIECRHSFTPFAKTNPTEWDGRVAITNQRFALDHQGRKRLGGALFLTAVGVCCPRAGGRVVRRLPGAALPLARSFRPGRRRRWWRWRRRRVGKRLGLCGPASTSAPSPTDTLQ